ncbi:olfactory receptor 6F1-like [Erythrolamprus reginae]|uniref:olfactory receptor 6F1-like n=1 Tax=Erythrolamprus reginae TaxID=121349 RepID=UPI00396CFFF6
MREGNGSRVKEFILLGFPGSCGLRISLFMAFFLMYLLIIIGNVSIIILVKNFQRLHTPMYFFLCNLSFLEIWYTSACIPKMLSILVAQTQTISFVECLTQMYIIFSLGCTEYFLLAAMAYDRYLAICYPLHYNIIMSKTLSVQMAFGCWTCGFLIILFPAFFISQLSFCDSNVINHFFCDIDPWIVLSCTSTYTVEIVCLILSATVIMGSCMITLISYIYIIATILRIASVQGRQRAFSTCSSHLTVVIIWYGATIFLHVIPSKQQSQELMKIVTLLNTIVTPLLNPFIYTLRNTEVQEALKAMFRVSAVNLSNADNKGNKLVSQHP